VGRLGARVYCDCVCCCRWGD